MNWEARDSIIGKMEHKKEQARTSHGNKEWASPAFTIVGSGASTAGRGSVPGSAGTATTHV